MNAQKKKSNTGKIIALGAGAVALSVAGYYLLGPDGKKNRKKVSVWSHKMKQEVLKKLGTLKHISQEAYEKAVDQVGALYTKEKGISKTELAQMVAQLKSHWNDMKKGIQPVAKKATKVAKKAVKKTAKKAPAKKAAKKKRA